MNEHGITPSERYLNKLAKRSFLTLWCYPNVYTNEGRVSGKGAAKELCDLLVVFGNDVLIFSDKYIKFNEDKETNVGWKRWYKKAIEKSAGQLFRAERWIVNHSERVFLDHLNTLKFPIPIPDKEEIRIHRICVANGTHDACRKYSQGESEGSLRLNSRLNGFIEHDTPFVVGQPNKERGFVHIFDELSLDRIFSEIDTITDFVKYLEKREIYLGNYESAIMADGEDQLLSIYLTNINKYGEHDFSFEIEGIDNSNMIFIDDSRSWNDLTTNLQYIKKKEADRISYIWDSFIEYFIEKSEVVNYTDGSKGEISDLEKALRFMVAENRLRRRQLGQTFYEIMESTKIDQKRARVVYSDTFAEKVYVFLILPHLGKESFEEYRDFRRKYLLTYCKVAKLKIPKAKYIIGIAQNPKDQKNVSEDILIIDVREWTTEMQKEAEELQIDLGLFLDKNTKMFKGVTEEYPMVKEPFNIK